MKINIEAAANNWISVSIAIIVWRVWIINKIKPDHKKIIALSNNPLAITNSADQTWSTHGLLKSISIIVFLIITDPIHFGLKLQKQKWNRVRSCKHTAAIIKA